MIAFIGGFVVCGIIAFILYLAFSKGLVELVKDNELTFAVYKNKEDVWEIPRNFDHVVKIIETRRKFGKPGAIKYID